MTNILTLRDTENNDGGEREFTELERGLIAEAEIVEVTVGETPWDKDENDPSKGKAQQVSFRFKLDDPAHPEAQNRQVFGNTPTTFSNHPDCKLRSWVEEILDTGLDQMKPGFNLNLDDLVGERVRVVIGHNKNGKARVEGVLRVKRNALPSF